ncbi:lysosome-associated membrane glycoprotein 5 [Zootermopsis nevadensis]|uniref:LAMP family protein n=1 Tax=Zootermopsis nevadensis TaxID=136037 RepID=A0A067RAG8_ZOONE|nr:lysosome-associated membrane glycoprotein 5 [Zootermopsis nevadensis]KDR15594.1 LAMP family protein [Zootermopsis nevadensis]
MKERIFIPFCLLALYTATQTATTSDAQSAGTTTTQPDEREQRYETVNLSEGALSADSSTTKGSLNGTTAPAGNSISLFSLSKDGAPCILLQVDALIEFRYKTKFGKYGNRSIYLPSDVTTSGDCKEEDTATFDLKWESFVLTWSFAKTLGRERWYVSGVQLRFDASEKLFENNIAGPRVLTSPESHPMFFPTPVGKSYSCQSETSLQLLNGDTSATLFLRGLKLQPFISKKDFGPVYECSPGGSLAFRDETAPIAVGSTLAVVVLLTVTGYGVYRYVKIKKVQYDTME